MRGALCERLSRWVDAPAEDVLDGFRDRDVLRGREITWDGGTGVADGIDDDGNLRVETDDGVVSLGAGEVSLQLS
jgi:BirA family biotin operon repressor/biotin-[acetyl-CoA-carboxylase] ligase